MRFRLNLYIATFGLLLLTVNTLAQPGQPQQNGGKSGKPQVQQIFGIIVSSVRGESITVIDRDGKTVSAKVNSITEYTSNKQPSNSDDAVHPGMLVKLYMSPENYITMVSARGPATDIQSNQIRAFMQVTDEEWAVISPRIEKVRGIQKIAEGRSSNNNSNSKSDNGGKKDKSGNGNPSQDQSQSNQLSSTSPRTLLKSLQMSFWNSDVRTEEMVASLNTLRETRSKFRADLAAARKELQEIVTPKQEVLLVLQGILE